MQKRIAAGAIIRNEKGEILIVKPTYKEGWLIPGGLAEEGELPSQTCARELQEELGLPLKPGKLIAVDFLNNETSAIQFVFDGGILSEEEIAHIVLPKEELSEFRFVSQDEAHTLLRHAGARRIPNILAHLNVQNAEYLENGEPLPGSSV